MTPYDNDDGDSSIDDLLYFGNRNIDFTDHTNYIFNIEPRTRLSLHTHFAIKCRCGMYLVFICDQTPIRSCEYKYHFSDEKPSYPRSNKDLPKNFLELKKEFLKVMSDCDEHYKSPKS